jgi:hypothetical protein
MYERLYEQGIDFQKDSKFIVNRWIYTTFCGWNRTGYLYEKYDARRLGEAGYGGEYIVQDGFGWTNGVILYFLDKYGDLLQAPSDCDNHTWINYNINYEQEYKSYENVQIGPLITLGMILGIISLSIIIKRL